MTASHVFVDAEPPPNVAMAVALTFKPFHPRALKKKSFGVLRVVTWTALHPVVQDGRGGTAPEPHCTNTTSALARTDDPGMFNCANCWAAAWTCAKTTLELVGCT